MAALVVQSRFAGLKIEDDDSAPSRDGQKAKKNKTNTANHSALPKKPDASKKAKPTPAPAKPQSAPQNKKKKSKANATTSEQWEQWKQKDAEMADGNFEDELQQAILLSKLDFEEKKDVYKQLKKDADVEKKVQEQTAKAGNKKQKKKNVMSLDQFNDMVAGGEDQRLANHENDKESTGDPKPDKDTEFFERVKDEAKNELLKDKIIDRVRNRQTVSNELITRVQFAEVLEKKDKEISLLKQEVKSLQDELLTVKSRNKKLYSILGHGEMKDKAQILVEVEKLRGVQAELTTEVEALHTELEKERSKNADSRTKDKKKKAVTSEKEK